MAQDFNVEIKGLDELKRAFEHYPSIAEPRLQRGVKAAADILAKNTKGSKGDRSFVSPVPVQTSNLLHSFRREEGRLWARWYPTAKYAADVEFGTGPHMIYPKNGKALAIPINGAQIRSMNVKGGKRIKIRSASGKGYSKASVNEHFIFRKWVRSPGTKANPYMERILGLSKDEINETFVRTMELIVKDITTFK